MGYVVKMVNLSKHYTMIEKNFLAVEDAKLEFEHQKKMIKSINIDDVIEVKIKNEKEILKVYRGEK